MARHTAWATQEAEGDRSRAIQSRTRDQVGAAGSRSAGLASAILIPACLVCSECQSDIPGCGASMTSLCAKSSSDLSDICTRGSRAR